jgi:hypothetical protein
MHGNEPTPPVIRTRGYNMLTKEQLQAIKARRDAATPEDIDALLTEVARVKAEWRFWSAFWKDKAEMYERIWRESETLRQTGVQDG